MCIRDSVSIVAPSFAVLVAARAAAGLALGVLTWLAYSQVFGDDDRTGDIAVVGPIAGVVASPLIGLVLTWGDDRHVFAALALVTLVPLLRVPHFVVVDVEAPARTRAAPQAFVLIVALALLTFGGVGVFAFRLVGVFAFRVVGVSGRFRGIRCRRCLFYDGRVYGRVGCHNGWISRCGFAPRHRLEANPYAQQRQRAHREK